MSLNIRSNIEMIKKGNIEKEYFAKGYKLYRSKTRWTLKLNMKSINLQTEALIKFYVRKFIILDNGIRNGPFTSDNFITRENEIFKTNSNSNNDSDS